MQASIDAAALRIYQSFDFESVALVVGFSYGGVLAFHLNALIQRQIPILCVSTTRLRYYLPQMLPQNVFAIFGAQDSHRPNIDLPEIANPQIQILPNEGHHFYQRLETCTALICQILDNPNVVTISREILR